MFVFLNVFTNDYVLCAGYLIVGFAHAKCFLYNTSAQWFGPDVTCKRKILLLLLLLIILAMIMMILFTLMMMGMVIVTFTVSSGSSSP